MIKHLKESHSVTTLCDAFQVHRSSYKYWTHRSKTMSPKKLNEHVMVKDRFCLNQELDRSVYITVSGKGISKKSNYLFSLASEGL